MSFRFPIRFKLVFLILNSAFLILSDGCKQDQFVAPPSTTMNYVSNDVGRWMIYDVDSIYHQANDSNSIDTFLFQIKEVIDSMGVDLENQPVQNLSRYKRLNDTLPWVFYERFTAKITAVNYQRMEENVRYINLGFPIISSQTWNGNAFNSLGAENYFYGAINQPATYGSFYFDSTLTVIQGDSTIGFVNYPFGMEMYATGIGRYYRYYADVDYYPGTNIITDGLQYYERINSHGHY